MVKHKYFEETIKEYAAELDKLGTEFFTKHRLDRLRTKTLADFSNIGIQPDSVDDIMAFLFTDKNDRRSNGIKGIIIEDNNEKVTNNGFLGITYLLARDDIPSEIKESIQELYFENPKHPYKFVLSHAKVFGLLNESEVPNEKSLENFKEVLDLEVAKVKELKEINKEYGDKNTEIILGLLAGSIKLQGFESKEAYVEVIKNTCSQLKEIFSSDNLEARNVAYHEIEQFRRDSIMAHRSDFTLDFLERIDEIHKDVSDNGMDL